MSTTRYKIRLWEYDGEASVANAVTFDSFDEAQARFNDLRVSEEMLDKVKLALRLSGTALDGEVSDLINAAIADLRLVGINIPAEAGSSSKTLGDPLLDRAVVL